MDKALLKEFRNYINDIKDNKTIKNYLNKNKYKSYKSLDLNNDNSVEVTNEILNELKIDKLNMTTLKFIFHELISNIYDHSKSKNASIIGICKKDHYEFLFLDDGITIPNSLRYGNNPIKNDCDGVIEAINGLSTKNDFGFIERGTGLNNTVNIVISGGNGEIIIASGHALIYITSDEIIKEKASEYINGTKIILRLKLHEKIDIYKYLKPVNY